MSTTIENRRIGLLVVGLHRLGQGAWAMAAWSALVAAGTWWFEPTPEVVVIAASRDDSLRAISRADGGVAGWARIGVVAQGDARGFVTRLYRSGAWLVLPARAGGCAGRLARSAGSSNP